jgi:hypothetical protein
MGEFKILKIICSLTANNNNEISIIGIEQSKKLQELALSS